MSERVVYISPYQLGALAALGEAINLPGLLEHRDPINVEAIVYGSMIQCGIEKFEIPKGVPTQNEKKDFSESKFLKARISHFSDSKGKKSQEVVKSAFDRFLPENFRANEEFSNVMQLEQFISDLIFSAERKTSCMTMFPVPDTSKFENQLPPEILFPVKHLLNSFEQLNPSLPYPKLSVRSADIKNSNKL